MDTQELKLLLSELEERLQEIKTNVLLIDQKSKQLGEIEIQLSKEEVWSNLDLSQRLSKEKTSLEKVLASYQDVENKLSDSILLLDVSIEENDDSSLEEILNETNQLRSSIEELEFSKMFKNKMDPSSAFIEIQSGSGGTEAQDWAEMLLRMYTKWAESRNFSVELAEISYGEVAGIKSASLHVEGDYAYGWLRTETGIHRLVRKSPFDSGNRRHTSFASIFVSPEINDDIEIEIDPSELRIDVFRASGAGGQHVNKTESAVRITHLKSGVVTQCQNGRSQHKNKDTAMKQLKAKLYEIEMQKKRNEQDNIENEKADIGWGSQIRSYVLDQSRIKDLRTNIETSNTQSVLDGNIDLFIEASLKIGEK